MRLRYLGSLITILNLFCFISSCNKNMDQPAHDVYASGSINNVAVYWKNNEVHYLEDANVQGRSYGISIFVIGDDVYVAGSKTLPDYTTITAAYWKNGVPTYLSTG